MSKKVPEMRNNPPDKINLQISKIEIAVNKLCPKGCMRISWNSDIGFGQYDLILQEDGSIKGDSEYMDINEDKAFISELMKLFVDKIKLEE
jgi:hypothetical protein